jgi:hypothetical protein
VIGTSRDIRREVDALTHDIEPWQSVSWWIKKIGGDKAELTGSYAKVPVPDSFDMRGLPDVDDHAELLHQLLPDTQRMETPKPKSEKKKPKETGSSSGGDEDAAAENGSPTFQLRSLIFHNNGTPFKAALFASSTEHFFDPTAGFVETGMCKSGGIDVHPDVYPAPMTRRDTLSWALSGIRALGWGAVNSVDDRRAVLPTPLRWTTVSGYRALTVSGGIPGKGPHLTWQSVGARCDIKLKVWAPVEDGNGNR